MKRRLLIAIAMTAMIAGCAPWKTIDSEMTYSTNKRIGAAFPMGWAVAKPGANQLVVTKEGPFVHQMQFLHEELKSLFNDDEMNTENLLITELADLYTAKLKKEFSGMNIERLSLEPTLVAGKDAFKAEYQFANGRGLRMRIAVYGMADGEQFYELRYLAPELHFFEQHISVFEQAIASLQVQG